MSCSVLSSCVQLAILPVTVQSVPRRCYRRRCRSDCGNHCEKERKKKVAVCQSCVSILANRKVRLMPPWEDLPRRCLAGGATTEHPPIVTLFYKKKKGT